MGGCITCIIIWAGSNPYALAQFERDLIAERTREGLAAARARGRKGGRPHKAHKNVAKALTMYDSMQFHVDEICEACGMSKPTLYRYIRLRNKQEEPQ